MQKGCTLNKIQIAFKFFVPVLFYNLSLIRGSYRKFYSITSVSYEGRTESHEQLFFACELGTADEGEYGGRWNQLLCYP